MISSSEAIGYLIFLERIFLPAKLNITISGWLWFQSYTCSKAFPFPIFKSAFHQIRSSKPDLPCLTERGALRAVEREGLEEGRPEKKKRKKRWGVLLTRQLNRKVSSRTQEEAITRAQAIDMRKYECPSGLRGMLICGASQNWTTASWFHVTDFQQDSRKRSLCKSTRFGRSIGEIEPGAFR